MDTELQSIRKLSSIKMSRTSSIASRSETPDHFDIDDHRYTSLKDIIVTNSPSWHNAMTSRSCDQFNDFDPSNIAIKNQLVKHAASAYVQSTAILVCRHQNCFHTFWEQVLWHHNMTCFDYKSLNPYLDGEETIRSLAKSRCCRECDQCKHMIELAEGCYHIICRCGYQFCYTCGAEWRNKEATCKCPLWDERYIIRA